MQNAMRSASALIPARARMAVGKAPVVRHVGLAEYAPTYQAMRRFTDSRGTKTPDELWVLEHPPAYTVGIAGRAEHLPRSGEVPVERVDRGGQNTHHRPGHEISHAPLGPRRRDPPLRRMVG